MRHVELATRRRLPDRRSTACSPSSTTARAASRDTRAASSRSRTQSDLTARRARSGERCGGWQPAFVPDEEIPAGDETDRLHRWGYRRYREMFNARQLLGLELICRLIAEIDGRTRPQRAGDEPLGPAALPEHALPLRHDGAEVAGHLLGPRLPGRTGAVRIEPARHQHDGKARTSAAAAGRTSSTSSPAPRRTATHRSRCSHRGGRKVQVTIPGEWIGDARNGTGPPGSGACGSLRGSATRRRAAAGLARRRVHRSAVLRQRAVRRANGLLLRLAAAAGQATACCLRGGVDAQPGGAHRKRDHGPRPRALHRGAVRGLPANGSGTEARGTRWRSPTTTTGSRPTSRSRWRSSTPASCARPRCPARRRWAPRSTSTGPARRSWTRCSSAAVQGQLRVGSRSGRRRRSQHWRGKTCLGLQQAGLEPTRGDMRCIIFGHLVRLAIWRLRPEWSKDAPASSKVDAVAAEIARLGGWAAPEEILGDAFIEAPFAHGVLVGEAPASLYAGESDAIPF